MTRSCLSALVVVLGLSWIGCAGAKAPLPAAAPEPTTISAEVSPVETTPETLEASQQHQVLAGERVRSIELEQEAVRLRAELAAAQRRYEALEAELADTVEEVLRAKASMRGVQSRALATSRIAEVRVALQQLGAIGTTPGALERGRATQFLERADAELRAENYGGAVYLAEKASDLVRQARADRATSPVPTREMSPVVPLMPTLEMTIRVPANLREGPGVEFGRRGLLPVGEGVTVLARSGDWRHVERAQGDRGWLHSRLLELSSTSAADASEKARALDPAQSMETVENANLRLGPGLAFDRIVVLDRGEALRAVASLGDWIQVERGDGRRGWVYRPLVRAITD